MSLFNFMFDETNWGDKVWLGSNFFKVLQPEEIFMSYSTLSISP